MRGPGESSFQELEQNLAIRDAEDIATFGTEP